LRLTAIDGSTLDVPNSPQNRAEFDGPSNDAGPGAFPQVRLLVHAECGTKALLNAGFDGYRTAETVLAGRLFDSFGPGMLVLADRNFLSWKLWRDAAATKAWRVSDSFTLPVLERLPDGSYLSRLNPPRKKDGDPITVRVIEYSVTTRDEHGPPPVNCSAWRLPCSTSRHGRSKSSRRCITSVGGWKPCSMRSRPTYAAAPTC
jgi:hypothetical protein